MAHFYLRAVAERRRIAAVCYQQVEGGRPVGRFTVLLADEWGERGVLRKLKEIGLFGTGESFVPNGPGVEVDLTLLVARAVENGVLRWRDEDAQRFVSERVAVMGRSGAGGKETRHKKETNKQLIENLQQEEESFLRDLTSTSESHE